MDQQIKSKLISELTYVSYATQRDLAPEISPERWGKIYGPESVEQMEERYQAEQEDKYGSCKICGERYAYADMSSHVCLECSQPDLADYRHEQQVDRELLA